MFLLWLSLSSSGYFEAYALAKDYRSLGFRECLAETARYLSIIEGRDSTDPLRIRLVSHLSNYASQREVHTGLEHLAWGSAYGSAHPHQHLMLQHPQGRTLASRSSSSPPSSTSSPSSSSEGSPISSLSVMSLTDSLRVPPNGSLSLTLTVPGSKLSPPLLSSLSSMSAFPLSIGAFPLVAPSALGTSSSSTLSKPYRPWGTEIGAFWWFLEATAELCHSHTQAFSSVYGNKTRKIHKLILRRSGFMKSKWLVKDEIVFHCILLWKKTFEMILCFDKCIGNMHYVLTKESWFIAYDS